MLQTPPEAILGASRRQRGSQEASGGLRGRFWKAFLLIFARVLKVFRMFYRLLCLMNFQVDLLRDSPQNLLFFRSARKRPTCENATPSMPFAVFQGARLRRHRRQGKETTHKYHRSTASKMSKTPQISYFFELSLIHI